MKIALTVLSKMNHAKHSLSILTLTLTLCVLVACVPTGPPNWPTAAAISQLPTLTRAPLPPLTTTPPAAATTTTSTSTPDSILTPTNTLEPAFYEVQRGDTLLAIALQFNVPLNDLILANGITEGDVMQVGRVLVIPHETTAVKGELPVYYVQVGDSFRSIAQKFDITVEMLTQANPAVTPAALQVGQAVNLPIDVHVVAWGETLVQIAEQYSVSLDDLFIANKGKIDPATPNLVIAGTILNIPTDSVAAGYDCSPQPARTEVLEYVVQPGEQRLCLEQKFGVSSTTILYANISRVPIEDLFKPGTSLLIPPSDGALYTITTEDITNAISQEDIVRWYGIQRLTDVTDWQGNSLPAQLTEGQQLFIRNADLQAGPFRAIMVAQAPSAPSGEATDLPGISTFGPDFRWDTANKLYDIGYCDPIDGDGWAGSLIWPVESKKIQEDRNFRPGHSAIDIPMPLGSPVYAAESGVVIWAGWASSGEGNLIVLAHGDGWRTEYAHLEKFSEEFSVECGQGVDQKQMIGIVGMTATSYVHLHFAVSQNKNYLDPERFLP